MHFLLIINLKIIQRSFLCIRLHGVYKYITDKQRTGTGWKLSWPDLRHYPSIGIGLLRKITRNRKMYKDFQNRGLKPWISLP